MMHRLRPPVSRILLAVLVAGVAFAALAKTGGIPIGAGGGGGGPTLFSQTLVNDGTNTGVANAPTTIFALSFQDSNTNGLTAGTWPTLKIGSTVQPYTPLGVGYWASGRIKHMGVSAKLTASTAAAASQTITVNTGGSQPAVSGRSLATDLYGQGFQIEAIGAGANFGLTGNYVARMAANDTHTYVVKTETWGDGQAGLVVALWLNFFPANGSFVATSTTPHGQLMAKVYVHILNDGSNNLGGFLMDARVVQPKYNNDTPAKAARAMTTLRYNLNGTLVNFSLDTTPRTFSWVSSGLFATSGTNPWYTGANGSNQLAAMVTAAGTTGLSTSTLYYGITNGSSTTQFSLSADHSDAENPVTGSSGTGTIQPLYVVGTFNSLYGLDANFNWVYNQGTGSIASSSITNWRAQSASTADRDYLIGTNLIPSFDKTYTGVAFGGSIAAAPTYTYPFDVNSIGPMVPGQSSPGERPDLGHVTQWAAQYAYNQDKNGLNVLRSVAYATKGSQYCFLDQATLTPPNIAEANGGTSFTGYPASLAQTLNVAGSGSGFTAPTWPIDSTYGFTTTQVEHAPEHEYMAWIMEARPEYWDMLNEQATKLLLEYPQDTNRNPAVPSQFYGVPAWPPGQEMRSFAHPLRQMLYAALGSPGKASDVTKLAPDSSDSAGYWKTLAENTMTYEKQVMDPALTGSLANLSSYANTNGYWSSFLGSAPSAPGTSPSLATQNYQQPYAIIPAGIYVAATGSADGKTWLQHIADWTDHARVNMGPWAQAPYYAHNAYANVQATPHWTPISNDTDYAQWGMHGGGLIWQNSTSPYFQQDMIGPYSYHNGDVVFFNQMTPPANFDNTASQRYILRDVTLISGTTYKFNLTTNGTPGVGGGTVIVPASTGSDGNPPMMHVYTYPSASTAGVCGNTTMQSSCINHYGMVRQLAHAGVSVTAGVLADLNSMVTVDSLKNVNDPRYLLAQ